MRGGGGGVEPVRALGQLRGHRAALQLVEGLGGQALDDRAGAGVLPEVRLGDVEAAHGAAAGAALEQMRQVAGEHLDAVIDAPVQGGLQAGNALQAGEGLVVGGVGVLEELGLPSLEAPELPGGGGDLLGVVFFEEVGGLDLGGEFEEDGVVAWGSSPSCGRTTSRSKRVWAVGARGAMRGARFVLVSVVLVSVSAVIGGFLSGDVSLCGDCSRTGGAGIVKSA